METNTTCKNKNVINVIKNILLLFIFFAICGWIYEVIWTYFDDGVWTNRGYLFGPWLPIYGFGGMLIYGIFYKQIKKPVYVGKLNIRFLLLFVYICLITTVVELAATYIIELFGTPFTVLWDYSDHFMNFQGRVCLDASARFGALGLMIIYGALPLYRMLISMKNRKVLNVIAWTVITAFVIDWILRIPLGNNYTGPV
jgi:uncharacterized membrane protein